MCLQPSKHTVLPCHLCLLLPSPVQNFPVPYLLSPAVCKQKRQICTSLFIHCLLLTPGWQGTLVWFSSWVSSLPPELSPGSQEQHWLLGMMFHSVWCFMLFTKHVLSMCWVAAFATAEWVSRTLIQGSLLTQIWNIKSVTDSLFLWDWVNNFTERFTCTL